MTILPLPGWNCFVKSGDARAWLKLLTPPAMASSDHMSDPYIEWIGLARRGSWGPMKFTISPLFYMPWVLSEAHLAHDVDFTNLFGQACNPVLPQFCHYQLTTICPSLSYGMDIVSDKQTFLIVSMFLPFHFISTLLPFTPKKTSATIISQLV